MLVRSRSIEFFLFITASGSALGSTTPPNQRLSEILYTGVKLTGHESVHSHQCNAEIKNVYLHLPIRLHVMLPN
jgi:hypothetical protein